MQVLKLQNVVARIMTSSYKLEHCRPPFRKLGIFTVASHNILVSLLHVHGNLRLYTMRDDVHSYNTRNKSKIDITCCNLSKSQNCFPVSALKLFNILPSQAKLADRKKFKCVASNWLLACRLLLHWRLPGGSPLRRFQLCCRETRPVIVVILPLIVIVVHKIEMFICVYWI